MRPNAFEYHRPGIMQKPGSCNGEMMCFAAQRLRAQADLSRFRPAARTDEPDGFTRRSLAGIDAYRAAESAGSLQDKATFRSEKFYSNCGISVITHANCTGSLNLSILSSSLRLLPVITDHQQV